MKLIAAIIRSERLGAVRAALDIPHLLALIRKQLWPAILSVPLLTLLTGAVFPLLLAALARPLFPHQSEGSLISQDGHVIGSTFIGQPFSGPGYFHPRPSAAGNGYDPLPSGGTNLGPSNPRLCDDVRQFAEEYRRENDLSADAAVPIDAVTRSGSGLDPHISPAKPSHSACSLLAWCSSSVPCASCRPWPSGRWPNTCNRGRCYFQPIARHQFLDSLSPTPILIASRLAKSCLAICKLRRARCTGQIPSISA